MDRFADVKTKADEVKKRMQIYGITQRYMVDALRTKGETIDPPTLCRMLSGLYLHPKVHVILHACDEFIEERIASMIKAHQEEVEGGRDGGTVEGSGRG